MGPPGSGKGTQCEILSAKFNFYYLESSKIIDAKLTNMKEGDFEVADGKKYFLSEQRDLRHSGGIMSPELVTSWMTEKMKELAKEGRKMVIAGSPRSTYEAEKEMPLLKKAYGKENIITIVITLSEEEATFRSAHRRICSLVRHPILYYKETENLKVCPLDGSELIERKDDNVDALKTRMKRYKEQTLPLLDYLKKEGYQVKEIAGRQTPAELHEDILKVLNA